MANSRILSGVVGFAHLKPDPCPDGRSRLVDHGKFWRQRAGERAMGSTVAPVWRRGEVRPYSRDYGVAALQRARLSGDGSAGHSHGAAAMAHFGGRTT